ncbi:MAG TPA: DUF3565 domain-containing protein [Gemmataceae bacterium]|jgi:hypothetical protein|nr:DUF3565 domain-containing protein [Gemmataceae bacterium]
MECPITGFHQDAEGDWVAELACGHNQHVRHAPPWECRPWVVTPDGRHSRLGVRLNCVKCDRREPPDRSPDGPSGRPADQTQEEPGRVPDPGGE